MFLVRVFLLIQFFVAISCISVKIPSSATPRSNDVKFVPPSNGFVSIQNDGVDAAWKSSVTGSIISLLTECPVASAELSLESLKSETLNGLTDLKIDLESRKEFLGREALASHVRGRLEGVESAIDLLIFKKNGCNYIVTLIATPRAVEADAREFQNFLKGINVP